jgi:uncharacterized membrane protein SirB2
MYTTLKFLHVGAVIVTGLGLLLHYALIRADSTWVGWRYFRIAPHAVDTVLLASAVGMAAIARLDPLRFPWLMAKLVGLVVYILAGISALRGPVATRPLALGVAIISYAYIVAVALAKHPLGPFAGAGT